MFQETLKDRFLSSIWIHLTIVNIKYYLKKKTNIFIVFTYLPLINENNEKVEIIYVLFTIHKTSRTSPKLQPFSTNDSNAFYAKVQRVHPSVIRNLWPAKIKTFNQGKIGSTKLYRTPFR